MAEAGDDDLFAGDDEDELTPIHLAEAEDPVETDIKIPSAEDMATHDSAEETKKTNLPLPRSFRRRYARSRSTAPAAPARAG